MAQHNDVGTTARDDARAEMAAFEEAYCALIAGRDHPRLKDLLVNPTWYAHFRQRFGMWVGRLQADADAYRALVGLAIEVGTKVAQAARR